MIGKERELRCVARAEHGEPAVVRDEVGVRGAIRERDARPWAELGRGGDRDDEMSEERELRRVAQGEHGEAAAARDGVDDGSGASCPGVHSPAFVMR